MTPVVPQRITVAVEALALRGDEWVLEVGCGRGVAADLICRRLVGGHLVALDRSEKAIAAATARNREHVVAGRACFLLTALADADPAALGTFDAVLAVNVNVFWTTPARAELASIAAALRPSGRLVLVYDPPNADRLRAVRSAAVHHLRAAGLQTNDADITAGEHSVLVMVSERPRRVSKRPRRALDTAQNSSASPGRTSPVS